MDWLTFIAHITSAVAWPAAALCIAALFREQIKALIARATRVSTPLGSIEAVAREAREEAEELLPDDEPSRPDAVDAEPVPEEASVEQPSPPPPAPPLNFPRDLDAAARLASVSPAEAIGMAWLTFQRDAERITDATEDFYWNGFRSPAANLALWGMGKSALEVVSTLEGIRLNSFDSSPSEEAAVNFVEAVRAVLFTMLSQARHPSRAHRSGVVPDVVANAQVRPRP